MEGLAGDGQFDSSSRELLEWSPRVHWRWRMAGSHPGLQEPYCSQFLTLASELHVLPLLQCWPSLFPVSGGGSS